MSESGSLLSNLTLASLDWMTKAYECLIHKIKEFSQSKNQGETVSNIGISVNPSFRNFPTSLNVQESSIQQKQNVSIVSNSLLLSEAIILKLKASHSLTFVSSYNSEIDFTSVVIDSPNHVVLLDSGIGQKATLAHIQKWRLLYPDTYIVVLELKQEIDLILDCIEAGAHGYALQGASSLEVVQLIKQVCQGITQCSPEITAKLFERLASKTAASSSEKQHLTRRELEVLHCLAMNYSDREIATELFIGVRTVKHHVHNILQKLNVKHRWNAAQIALEQHWLDLSATATKRCG